MEVQVIQDTFTVVREKLVFTLTPEEAVTIEDMITRAAKASGGSKAKEIALQLSKSIDCLSKESLSQSPPRVTETAVERGKRLIIAQMKKMASPGSSHVVLQAELLHGVRQLADTVGYASLRNAMAELTSGEYPALQVQRIDAPGSPIAVKWADHALVAA